MTCTEDVTAEIFDFPGVPAAPGITQQCFVVDHDRLGPGDHKIWQTSAVSSESVGRGGIVPPALIPPPFLAAMNGVMQQVGYVPVDEKWGTPDSPAELRALDRHGSPLQPAGQFGGEPEVPAPEGSRLLGERLRTSLAFFDDDRRGRWSPCDTESFEIVSLPDAGQGGRVTGRWRVDLAERSLSAVSDAGDVDWCAVGSAASWKAVLDCALNLNAALRRCEIRYCHAAGDDTFVTDMRMRIMGEVLGLTKWNPRQQANGDVPRADAVPV